jgi:hypothetical protein
MVVGFSVEQMVLPILISRFGILSTQDVADNSPDSGTGHESRKDHIVSFTSPPWETIGIRKVIRENDKWWLTEWFPGGSNKTARMDAVVVVPVIGDDDCSTT